MANRSDRNAEYPRSHIDAWDADLVRPQPPHRPAPGKVSRTSKFVSTHGTPPVQAKLDPSAPAPTDTARDDANTDRANAEQGKAPSNPSLDLFLELDHWMTVNADNIVVSDKTVEETKASVEGENPTANEKPENVGASETSHDKEPEPTETTDDDSAQAPLQQKSLGTRTGTASVHRVAASGVAGSGTRLPYFDVIQRAFGRHRVDNVQAHLGGAASEANQRLGSLAYASGNNIAFAGLPDLHTAAHEAAHIVQQRGGVRLKNNMSEQGDEYERHADAVADAVVRGESAEELLDAYAGGSAGNPSLQFQLDTAKPSTAYIMYNHHPVAAAGVDSPEGRLILYGGLSCPAVSKSTWVPPPADVAGGFRKARSIDTASLETINTNRTTLDQQIAEKAATIDAALAQDKASGAKLEAPLDNAVNTYLTELGLVKTTGDKIHAHQNDVIGLVNEMAAIKGVRETQKKVDETNAEEKAAQDAAKATIAKTHKYIEKVGSAVIDTAFAIPKGKKGIPDAAKAAAKLVLFIVNDTIQDSRIESKKAEIKAKFAAAKQQVTAENAAQFENLCSSIQTQADAARGKIDALREEIDIHAASAARAMGTILKNSSKLKAFAPIQDFLMSVGDLGAKQATLVNGAIGDLAFEQAGWSGNANAWLKADLEKTKPGVDSWMNHKGKPAARKRGSLGYYTEPAVPGVKPEKLIGLVNAWDAWQMENIGLQTFTTEVGTWVANNLAELKKQLTFVSGEHLKKGQAALAEIAKLGVPSGD